MLSPVPIDAVLNLIRCDLEIVFQAGKASGRPAPNWVVTPLLEAGTEEENHGPEYNEPDFDFGDSEEGWDER